MSRNNQSLRTSAQLGMLLRSARKARKVTQGQLALRMGVSQSRVSQLELQPGDMTVDQLLSACAALGLELKVGEKSDMLRIGGAAGTVDVGLAIKEARIGSAVTKSQLPSTAEKVSPAANAALNAPTGKADSLTAKVLARKLRKGSW